MPSRGEQTDLQKDLESHDVSRKTSGLKRLLRFVVNGVQLPNLVMTVIRYCITTTDHKLKKLLLLYWESVNKLGEDGVLRPEFTLVINALLSDLNHANEYVRGCTLRFLCRISEQGLISHLIEPIKTNLTYRHAYVRRQAALAVAMIRRRFGEELIPDADELLDSHLVSETDAATRRDVFMALFWVDAERALRFYGEKADQVAKYGDSFALAVLELARRTCKADPTQKARFVKTVFQLLQSESATVVFEAGWTLVSLSTAPTAIRAASSAYTHLLAVDSDNNIKLVVLDKLAQLQKAHPKILQDSLMDMLRALASPNSDIRRKTLDICMELVTPQNVDEVILVLKKEVVKTQAKDIDKDEATEYRKMLVQAIHSCAVKFPGVAAGVVDILMDFLNGEGALDVVIFVRELAESQPAMRSDVVNKLVLCLGEIRVSNVARVGLWILGEYVQQDCEGAFDVVEENVGSLDKPKKVEGEEVDTGTKRKVELTTTVTVLPDGTYATQTALSESTKAVDDDTNKGPAINRLIVDGDLFLGAVAMVAMTKLVLRMSSKDDSRKLKTLIFGCQLLKLCKAPDADSKSRIETCIRVLLEKEDNPSTLRLARLLAGETRLVFEEQLRAQQELSAQKKRELEAAIKAQPFDVIPFRQLRARATLGAWTEEADDERCMALALGTSSTAMQSSRIFKSKTNRQVNVYTNGADAAAGPMDGSQGNIHALTGSTDPVYVEATVTVVDFDILLDFLVINRTDATLTNVEIELCTVGDLKLGERHLPFTLGPRDHKIFQTSIKVASTETGHVYGNVTFDHPQIPRTTVIALADIHLDVLTYIRPAHTTDAEFRTMWAEFEWENKVAVFTVIEDCRAFLEHVMKLTNMACLTEVNSLESECDFLAANLFAKSIFGEAALLNVSVEKASNGKVEGFIRIRAKNQGVALSLGDKLTMGQKGSKKESPVPLPTAAAPHA